MVFLKSVAHGIITSFVLFFVPYGAFKNAVGPEGINLDGHQLFGTVVSTILVIVVTSQVSASQKVDNNILMIVTFFWLDCTGHLLLDSVQSHCHLGQCGILFCAHPLHQQQLYW